MHDDDRTLGDDALRARLRAADPAAETAPLPPTWLDHRMEQLMTDTTTTPAAPEATGPSRPRIPRWMPVAGAAAAVAIVAAIVAPLALGGTQPTVETIRQSADGDPAAGACAMITAEAIAEQPRAFAATAVAVDDRAVTLRVTERFAGEVADEVRVMQWPEDSDFSGVAFTEGETYLLAATDDALAACGLSGPDSPELRALYDEAFGG